MRKVITELSLLYSLAILGNHFRQGDHSHQNYADRFKKYLLAFRELG
jgi:hypothetical protein